MIKFTLFDVAGTNLTEWKSTSSLPAGPDHAQNRWGRHEFFKSNETKDLTWRLICEVEFEHSVVATPLSDSCVSSLQQDLLKLLESSANSDVTLVVKGEKI